MNVPNFRGPCACPHGILRILCQEDAIALKMRAAARGIGNDRIELIHIKRINLPAGELFRRPQLSVVRVQRAATILNARSVDFASVDEQDVNRIAIDFRKNNVLHSL